MIPVPAQPLPLFLAGRSPATPQPSARFVTRAHPSGRYLLDQYGEPLLIRGSSYWGAVQQITTTADIRALYSHIGAYGGNAAIVDVVGSVGVGGNDNGQTSDGVAPFVGGDITQFNPTYWARVDQHVVAARDNGVTLWLIAMDWYATGVAGTTFNGKSSGDCQSYGANLSARYPQTAYPNIVWMFGNDYDDPPGSANTVFSACLTGIRSTGDTRMMTIMLGEPEPTASTDTATWEAVATINCVYTYPNGYDKTLACYRRTPGVRDPRPAIGTESRYEGDTWFTISGEPNPNTEAIRRQELWWLTSGSCGAFYGNNDWRFPAGWQGRLTSWTAENQLRTVRDWWTSLPWTTLVPDDQSAIVTAGRGTYSSATSGHSWDNDYVTACYNAAGTCAAVYIPTNSGVTSRTVTIDPAKMQAGFRAYWVDPTNALNRFPATPSGNTYTDPGTHTDGYRDWILWLTI